MHHDLRMLEIEGFQLLFDTELILLMQYLPNLKTETRLEMSKDVGPELLVGRILAGHEALVQLISKFNPGSKELLPL